MSEEQKAWSLLEKVVTDSQREQKKARRWSIFFKLLTFLYLGVVLFLFVSGSSNVKKAMHMSSESGDGFVASIDVNGVIANEGDADAELIMKGLQNAFEDEQTKAIILKINSPGGSPVQSGYVYDEIKRLRAEHKNIKVYAVIEDLGASGAYYIAAAADKIYADKASLVGSIGVISSSFGFVEAMDKIGVERRAYHAGDNKAMLDPFSPENPEQTAFWQEVLNVTHQQFINQVKKGRGDRLKDDPKLFTGLIWSGEQALELGLIDGLGNAAFVADTEAGTSEIVDFSVTKDPFQQFIGRLGASIGKGIAQTMGLNAQLKLQ